MSKRTEREKYAMGLLSPIFRELNIKLGSRGSIPLTDLICYLYAYPEVHLEKAMEILLKRNSYIGVRTDKTPEEIEEKAQKNAKEVMQAALKSGCTVEEAEERGQEELMHVRGMLIEKSKLALYPSMKRCIATALERGNVDKYGLSKLTIILEDSNPIEEERIKQQLLEIIGEEYSEYKTYEQRVTAFFVDKILEHMRK